MSIRTRYESLMARWAHYPPNYNPFAITTDGVLNRLPRLVIQLQWTAYSVGIAGALLLVHAPAWLAVALAIAAPLTVKGLHVALGTYRVDPLDWLSDVGGCGTFGALLTARVFGAPVAWCAWPLLSALWLVTFPWASP